MSKAGKKRQADFPLMLQKAQSAHFAWKHENHNRQSVFSIYKDFRAVEGNFEPCVFSKLSSALKNTVFSAQYHVVELNGICARCEL